MRTISWILLVAGAVAAVGSADEVQNAGDEECSAYLMAYLRQTRLRQGRTAQPDPPD